MREYLKWRLGLLRVFSSKIQKAPSPSLFGGSGPLIKSNTGHITCSVTGLSPLCPLCDVTGAKHKAVFHGAAAYLASESMWDMPGNKGASLSPRPGWAYPFHRPHISLTLRIWQAHGGLQRRMSKSGRRHLAQHLANLLLWNKTGLLGLGFFLSHFLAWLNF